MNRPLTLMLFTAFVVVALGSAAEDAIAAPELRSLTQAVPQVGLPAGPIYTLIGAEVELSATFTNQGAIGYGPFIDLILDARGADGNDSNEKCDGLEITSVSKVVLKGAPPADIKVFGGGLQCDGNPTSYPHPWLPGGPSVSVPKGQQLVSIRLPVGSYGQGAPPLEALFSALVSDYADELHPLTVRARSGFIYGNQPAGLTPIVGGWTSTTVIPLVVLTGKKYLGPEDENATGLSQKDIYPLRYEVSALIAPGQTITDLVLSDKLPSNMVFDGFENYTAGCNAIPPGPTPSNSAVVKLECPSASGIVSMEFWFHIPKNDADGQPVLDLSTCATSESVDDIAVSGHWDPLDPRDPEKDVLVDFKVDDHTLSNKCLAVQKSVTVAVDEGAPGPTPGDLLDYTIAFQVSDFIYFGDITIEDFLSDGQSFDFSSSQPILTVSDGTRPSPLVIPWPVDDLAPVGVPDRVCGSTYPDDPLVLFEITGGSLLTFDVSKLMRAQKNTGSKTIEQGALVGGGSSLGKGIPGQGTITFRARIDEEFNLPQPGGSATPGNAYVDKHDPLCNEATLRAHRLDFGEIPGVLTGTSVWAEDGTKSVIQIVPGSLEKLVVARNGDLDTLITDPVSGLYEYSPGDTITFEIVKHIPSGDAEDVVIEDWLPLPILDTTGFVNGQLPNCTNFPPNGIPGPGQACWSFDAGTVALDPLMPSLTVNAPNNLVFSMGDLTTTPFLVPQTLRVRLTATLTDVPYADGLHLTNLARECEQNTLGRWYCETAAAAFKAAAPRLRIRKGVVWTDNQGAVFSPGIGPITACSGSGWPGSVSSTSLSGVPDANILSGVDAGDTVRYAIVVENVGKAVDGAFHVAIKDVLPSAFIPGSEKVLCVQDGTGDLHGASGALFSSGGLSLSDPGPTTGPDGALDPFHPTSGRNLAIILIEAKVKPDVGMGCFTNDAMLVGYASKEGGDNHVPAGLAVNVSDGADVCVLPKITKRIVQTSEDHTKPLAAGDLPPLTIGEIVQYQVAVIVPEGSLAGLQVKEILPADLVYLPGTAKLVAAVPLLNGLVLTEPASVPSCGNPAPVVFDLGNVTNAVANGPQTINIVYNALVCNNAAANDAWAGGHKEKKTNTAEVWTSSQTKPLATAHTTATLVEPRLEVSKRIVTESLDLSSGTGQTVEYEIRVKNTSSVNAYNVLIKDPLVPCYWQLKHNGAWWILPNGSNGGAFGGILVAYHPNLVQLKVTSIKPDHTVVLRYKVVVKCRDCELLKNTVTVTWSSLPDAGTPNGQPGNKTGSTTPGPKGAPNGEREYSASASVSPCGQICGHKFSDLNANHTWETATEATMNGIPISLSSTGGVPVASTVTQPNPSGGGEDGWYCVSVLPGTYTVSETVTAPWVQTYPQSPAHHTVTVGPSEIVDDIDFGNADPTNCKSRICGVKFHDTDGDGVFDPQSSLGGSDYTLSGWTIQVLDAVTKDVLSTAVTSGEGHYCVDIPGGKDVIIQEVGQGGFTQTAPPPDGTYKAKVTDCLSNPPKLNVWRTADKTTDPAKAVDPMRVDFGNVPTPFCELDAEGNVNVRGPLVVWGWNYGTSDHEFAGIPATSSPVIVPGSFTDVAASTDHIVAIDSNKMLHAWESPNSWPKPLNVLSGVPPWPIFEQVAAGGHDFALALDKDGNIWSWGDNTYKQLPGSTFGLQGGSLVGLDGACVKIPGPPNGVQCKTTGTTFTAIAAGLNHALAVDTSGVLHGWGSNDHWQLPGWWEASTACNSKSLNYCRTTSKFKGFQGAVAGGWYFSAAINANGGGETWGWNNFDEFLLGNGCPTGEKVRCTDPGPFASVAAEASHTIWIREGSGALLTHGLPAALTGAPSLKGIPALPFRAVAAGHFHGMAIDADWSLHPFGDSPIWNPLPPLLNLKFGKIAGGGWGDDSLPYFVTQLVSHGAAIACEGPCGYVCGRKFNDLNRDGLWTKPGESGLPGWTMQLKDGAGKVVASAVTDVNGQYCLAMPPGSKGTGTVVEVPKTSVTKIGQWSQTAPAGGTYKVDWDCASGSGPLVQLCPPGQPCSTVVTDRADFGNAYGAPPEASNKVASITTSSALPTWPSTRLADGRFDQAWSSVAHTEHLAGAEWAVVHLPRRTRVDGIRLTPRQDPANPASSLGFPEDFVLQYSYDGDGLTCNAQSPRFHEAGNWRALTTQFGYPQPWNESVTFLFEPRGAGCVRLLAVQLSQDDYGNRYLQMAGMEALSDDQPVPQSGVSVSSALRTWPKERLVDDDPATAWSSNIHTEHLAGAEWLVTHLPRSTAIDGVRLTPRSDPANPASSLGFPKALLVQYSNDLDGHTCDATDPRFARADNWWPLLTRFGFPQPTSGPVTFAFPAKNAGCVRFFGVDLSQDDYGNRYLQMAGMEALSGDQPVPQSGVSVSSALRTWPKERVVDGDPATAWSSNVHTEHLASAEWIVAHLPRSTSIDRVRLTPRSDPANPSSSLGFPKAFLIQHSNDLDGHTCDAADPRFARADNWLPLLTRVGFPPPSSGPVTFSFPAKNAGCVRFFGVDLSQDDYGNHYMQMEEIELFSPRHIP